MPANWKLWAASGAGAAAAGSVGGARANRAPGTVALAACAVRLKKAKQRTVCTFRQSAHVAHEFNAAVRSRRSTKP